MAKLWKILLISLIVNLACIVPLITSTTGNPTPDLNATMMVLGIQQTQTAMARGGESATTFVTETVESSSSPMPADTSTITATETLRPTETITPSMTNTPIPCNWVGNVIDVNYTDGTKVLGDTVFVKTWRITNRGSCTWTSGYSLVFYSGDRMDAPAAVPLTAGTVPPGGSVEISVQLKAPHAKGTYRGNYLIQAPGGALFGFGPGANEWFWVEIKVPAPTAVPLPDLKVTGIQPCAAPKMGVACLIKVSVYNSGEAAAIAPFKVKLYVGSAPDAKCVWDIASMAMNGGYVKSCSYTFPSWYGSIALRAVIDEANVVVESNEGNNTETINISVAN